MNLRYLKNQEKFTPKAILDIGCNVGKFYKQCRNVWGDSFSAFLIDGNYSVEEDLIALNVPYYIGLLSDCEKDVTFYLETINPKCTGASYYRENTRHYTDDKISVETRVTETLDTLMQNETFDFIKIDTQGSEIDIMRGGKNLISKAKYVLLEVSHVEYNIGSPMMKEVDEYMKSIGYKKIKVIDNRKNEKGIHIQSDVIYKNTKV